MIDGVGMYFDVVYVFVLLGMGGFVINEVMVYWFFVILFYVDGSVDDLVIDGVIGYWFCENFVVEFVV